MSTELWTYNIVEQRHAEFIEHARQDRLARESGFRPWWQRALAQLSSNQPAPSPGRAIVTR